MRTVANGSQAKPNKKAGSNKKDVSLRPNAGTRSAHSSASDAAASHQASSSMVNIESMTLIESPLKTSFLFARICVNSAIDAALDHVYIALALTAIAVAGYADVQLRTKDLGGGSFEFREDFSIAGIMHWVGLGFLSSFGMGFGLHMFVLFLAPAIIAHVSYYPALHPRQLP